MLLKRDNFQHFFEKKFTDHNQFLKKNVCTHLKGKCCESFSEHPRQTRMNAQIDKRTYFGNTGLTKIEERNPEPQHHMTIKV